MKKLLFTLSIVLITGNILFSQTPQSFKYQAVIRDASGAVLQNHTVGLQISLLQGSETGSSVYTETWTVTTNAFGLVSLNIGEGSTSDNLSNVDWKADNYWVKIELDENGGTNYTDMGTSKLLSVPYALYSKSPWESTGDTLFCVKDAQDRPVFIVFKDGVQVIVDTTATKSGASGRFLVSGRGINKSDKGTEMNFMDMTKKNYLIGNNVAPNINPTATTGIKNSILGYEAGRSLISGYQHTFVGYQSGYNSVGGNSNIFIGNNAGYSTQNGIGNVYIGLNAGYSNNHSTGSNVFIGQNSGYYNTDGSENVYIGYQVGGNDQHGTQNVYIGAFTGKDNDGNNNVFIGPNIGSGTSTTISNELYIDNSSTTTPLIWGDFANDVLKVYGTFGINDAYTFPTGDGLSGQVLKTDGSGNLTWSNVTKSVDNSEELKILKTTVKNQQLQIEKLSEENKNLELRIKKLEQLIK